MVIYCLKFWKYKFINSTFSIEREEQERKDKEAKDRKNAEDASEGKLSFDLL